MTYAIHKVFCFLLMATIAVSVCGKQPKDKNKYGVYLAGVSASFADSLVFFTDIQYLDSAAVDDKGFLVSRSSYSFQLKDYLEQKQGEKNRTCFMFFNRKKGKLEKEIQKLKEKYTKGKTLVIRSVGADFKFEKPEF